MKADTFVLSVFAIVLLTVWSAPAAELADEELLDMDFAKLLDVSVTVASKKAEHVQDAPGVVTVVTAEEIALSGANNLRDVFNRLPSTQVYGSSFIPDNVVSVRGQTFQHENNHMLLLINGRPFRDSAAAGFSSALFNGFPVELVERIEMIRGPGSVLYGSSAFSGVINIVTKTADKLEPGSISASYGNFNSFGLGASIAKKTDDWSVVAAVQSLESDGWDYSFTDQTGASDTFDTDDDDIGTFIAATYKNLTINGFYGEARQRAMQPNGLYPVRDILIQRQWVDVGYVQDLTSGGNIKYNVTYNGFDFGDVEIYSDDILGEVTAELPIVENLNLMLGGTWANDDVLFSDQNPLQRNTAHSNQNFSSYAQADYKPLDWLKLVAGVQYNEPRDADNGTSPRFAAIANFNENWGLKILHGDAFRSPSFVETDIDATPIFPIILGNPKLDPEKITTTDVQLFYQADKYSAAVTYYQSEITDLIERVPGGPITFTNQGGDIDFEGVELEGKAHLSKHFRLSGNVTWQTNENRLGEDDSTYTPNWMAKAGCTYDSHTGYTIGLHENYFGDPAQVKEFANGAGVANQNPLAEKYHLMTLNVTWDINKLWNRQTPMQPIVSLYVDNLLDEEIRFPDINAQHVNSIPIYSGRAAYVKLALKF